MIKNFWQIKVSYIGCGAVGEKSYLSAIERLERMLPALLIDQNQQQAKKLSAEFSVPIHARSFKPHDNLFDLAVVATPSASHHQFGRELLEAGKHVLKEKPLAATKPRWNR